MKCIVCNKAEGVADWWLYSVDFSVKGYDHLRYDLDECICHSCYVNGEGLDDALFNYWKSQQTVKETNKPNYYTWHPEIECYKVTQYFKGNLAQAIQYIWRVGNPEATKHQSTAGLIEDLQKAQNFIEFEISRLKEGK